MENDMSPAAFVRALCSCAGDSDTRPAATRLKLQRRKSRATLVLLIGLPTTQARALAPLLLLELLLTAVPALLLTAVAALLLAVAALLLAIALATEFS